MMNPLFATLKLTGFFLVTLCLCVGCKSLKKSQISLIGDYYNTITDYPSHIRNMNEKRSEIRLESDNLKSALFPSNSLRIYSLMEAIHLYEDNLTFPDSILNEIKFLESYIQGYYVLTPNGFKSYTAIKNTSQTVVGVFGLKSVMSALLPENAPGLNSAKKRKIHNHFKKNSDQLEISLTKLKNYIDDYVLVQIDETDNKIEKDIQLLFDDNENFSSMDHYFNYNKYFINYFQKIIKTKRLATKISQSLQHIINAENEIQQMTNERKKLDQESLSLHQLANDLQKIRVLLQ